MDITQAVLRENIWVHAFSANNEAKTLFKRLDPNLNPEVFVVAIPFQPNSTYLFVEPNEYNYSTDWFSRKLSLTPIRSNFDLKWFKPVQKLIQDIPESYLTDIAPDVRSDIYEDKVKVKTAIQNILNSYRETIGGTAFTTRPEFAFGYSISLILRFKESAIVSHYALSQKSILGYEKTSLIHETIAGFLASASSSAERISSSDAWFTLPGNGDELLRSAGFWLMNTIERASDLGVAQASTENLFHPCNAISSLPYEGNGSKGKMLISKKGHPNIEIALEFETALSMNDFRGVRKLLEMTSTELNLLCDSSTVYGLGGLSKLPYDEVNEDLFIIEFTNQHSWKLIHANNEMMVVKYGVPSLSARLITEDMFRKKVAEVFDASALNLDLLWQLFCDVQLQKHGTMLVITPSAATEADRLKSQSTIIKPVSLDTQLLQAFSSIDGAMLIEPNAMCHAIGVILDGLASKRGNPARGSRYNSAIRYLDYAKSENWPCIIVVVSEDGMVDLMITNDG